MPSFLVIVTTHDSRAGDEQSMLLFEFLDFSTGD
jgi:hypothetical protein